MVTDRTTPSVDQWYSPWSRTAGVQDCLFLSLTVVLSVILYIGGLGFYLDDYAYLEPLISSRDQSLFGLGQALYVEEVNTRMRPVEIFFLVSQYRLFGAHPLPYHLVNSAALLLGILLFYLVLRELRQPRLLVLTVPLVYAFLPHYSTDRLWIAASPHTLSATLYFLSIYGDLRALRNHLAHLWPWKLLSMISLVASGLAYEVALPLFAVHPLIIWLHAQQLYGRVAGRDLVRQNRAVLLASNLLLLILVLAFKVLMTLSLGNQTGLQAGVKRGGYLDYVAFLVTEAIRVNFGTYGLGLPYVVWRALHLTSSWTIIIVAGVLALVVFAYLSYVSRQTETALPSRPTWHICTSAGLVVFGLGYAIFLSTDRIAFSSAGLDNRVAIAAAIGVAFSFVGAIGWLTALLRSTQWAKRAFCLLVSLLCACGVLVINTVASFWITAYGQQQVIVADIRDHIPTLSPGSTLILAGVCPQIGPAVVFESHYDLAVALKLSYRQPALRADVAASSFRIGEKGISIRGRFYPYDEKLLLYSFGKKMIHRLASAPTTLRRSQILDSDAGCPSVNWGWRTKTSSPRF